MLSGKPFSQEQHLNSKSQKEFRERNIIAMAIHWQQRNKKHIELRLTSFWGACHLHKCESLFYRLKSKVVCKRITLNSKSCKNQQLRFILINKRKLSKTKIAFVLKGRGILRETRKGWILTKIKFMKQFSYIFKYPQTRTQFESK